MSFKLADILSESTAGASSLEHAGVAGATHSVELTRLLHFAYFASLASQKYEIAAQTAGPQ